MGRDLAEPRGRRRERVISTREIVPVRCRRTESDKEGNEIDIPETVTKDDGPRPGTTVEKLAALQPAFKRGRHGHGGQRLPAERRRRGAAHHVRERAKEPA